MKSLKSLGFIILICIILASPFLYDYYKYTKEPYNIVHIDYTVYTVSGEHNYVKDIKMKGTKFSIYTSGTEMYDNTYIRGNGGFVNWPDRLYNVFCGRNYEIKINSFYIKN